MGRGKKEKEVVQGEKRVVDREERESEGVRSAGRKRNRQFWGKET